MQVESNKSEMYGQRIGSKNIQGQSKLLATWVEKNTCHFLILTHFQ